jgi:hypothetical protein
MKPSSDMEPVPIPSALYAEMKATAEQEHRPIADLIREAVERYLEDRRWQKLLAYGQQRARSLGLTEADVPRLIAEYRRDRRPGTE